MPGSPHYAPPHVQEVIEQEDQHVFDSVGPRPRIIAQILIEEIGAEGPEAAENTAKRAVAVIQELRAQVIRERLRYGKQRARATVLMQALAALVRRGVISSDEGKTWIDKADHAGDDIRPEDFVHAHVNGPGTKDSG
jgi:hypothetical protein